MNLIGNIDYARRLARRLDLKERNPVATLSPEITPVVIVDDIREDQSPDMDSPMYGCAGALVTAAGQNFGAAVRNTTTSQSYIVSDIYIASTVTNPVFTTQLDNTLGSAFAFNLAPHFQNSRVVPDFLLAAGEFTMGTNALPSTAPNYMMIDSILVGVKFPGVYIVGPGGSFRLVENTGGVGTTRFGFFVTVTDARGRVQGR